MKTALTLASAVLICLTNSYAQQSKPLSKEDKARVDQLLDGFDPNSYHLQYKYVGDDGKVHAVNTGKARGLASVRQVINTEIQPSGQTVASTNTNNNVFKTASTNTNNNVFKTASTNTNNNVFKTASTNTNNNVFKVASTNTNNNVFKNLANQQKAVELNNILQKYNVAH